MQELQEATQALIEKYKALDVKPFQGEKVFSRDLSSGCTISLRIDKSIAFSQFLKFSGCKEVFDDTQARLLWFLALN